MPQPPTQVRSASNTQDVLAARAESDSQAGLDRLLAQIDELVWSDAYGVPLFAYPTVTAVSADVAGVTRSPSARTVFWNAWEWHPAEAGTAGE